MWAKLGRQMCSGQRLPGWWYSRFEMERSFIFHLHKYTCTSKCFFFFCMSHFALLLRQKTWAQSLRFEHRIRPFVWEGQPDALPLEDLLHPERMKVFISTTKAAHRICLGRLRHSGWCARYPRVNKPHRSAGLDACHSTGWITAVGSSSKRTEVSQFLPKDHLRESSKKLL